MIFRKIGNLFSNSYKFLKYKFLKKTIQDIFEKEFKVI
jgi:hypothetical protein